METNRSNSTRENVLMGGLNNPATKENSAEKHLFVNHAEISWHEIRKQWVGDASRKPQRMQTEPIMSWTTTYEDLLCSNEPFQQSIPLAEMVDFLVDIWHEDGLYD
ncbi:uncharacterized protein [Euphorbia lathyris]|uniref:uncharacterized protein n=1 Tax=Euphorbia lathyris TaxID=212925 RepID=UPI003313FC8C